MTEGLYEKAIKPLLDKLYLDINKFAFNKDGGDKFNFAIIKKSSNNITYEEFWILSNCYYNYDTKKFNTINTNKPCFGIQIQANGTYPGEEAYDTDNIGINVWRHAKSTTNTSWDTFGVTSGWYNAFMLDSYGGMTIGGPGFEIDGNGIYPFTRLTSSGYKDSNNNEYYLLGLLDNAYHPTTYSSWQMDDNSTYAWFFGLRTPKKSNASGPIKNNNDTEFVIMYNDTPFTTENNKHNLNVGKWHTVFAVNTSGIQAFNTSQMNNKGKNVVIDNISGNIAFEDMPTLSNLSTSTGELSIADIDGLTDAIEASFKPQVVSDITSTQVRNFANGGNLGSAFTELFRQSGKTINENTIYFIPNSNDDLSSYDEFLYIPSLQRFELIGTTQITLPIIADNLTTNDSTKVLSAKQGYKLAQDKLDKKQVSYKGKNIVVDNSSGDITFENKNNHTHIYNMSADMVQFGTQQASSFGATIGETSAFKHGMTISLLNNTGYTNGGSATLSINNEDGLPIYYGNSRLPAGALQTNIVYTFMYNTQLDVTPGCWQIINPDDTKEVKSNKSSSISTDTGSTTKYPTVKAVEDYGQRFLTTHQSLKDMAKLNAIQGILTSQADHTISEEHDIYTLIKDMEKTRTNGELYTESYFMMGQSNNTITIDKYKYGYNIITVTLGNIEISQINVGQQVVIQTSIEIPPSYKVFNFDGTTDTGNSDIQIKIDTEGKMYATLTRKGTSTAGTHSVTAMGIYVPL